MRKNSALGVDKVFSDQAIQEIILNIIKKKKPETIENLVDFIRADFHISEAAILRNIEELEDSKKVEFNSKFFPVALKEFMFSFKAMWYWSIIFLIVLAHFAIWFIPDDLYFLAIRNAVGLLVVLYLPGYSIIKALYPVSVPFNTQSNMLDAIERVALSLGLSLAVVPVVGFALYYLPSGLDLFPLSESILVLTFILSTLAIWREYRARRTMFLRRVRKNTAFFSS